MSSAGRIKLPADCARRYEAMRVIGRGGFGAAVLAFDRELGRKVIIKLLFGAEPETVARFAREARLTAQLNHENVVKVLDHVADGDVPWIAYEYIEGRTLREVMDSGRIPLLRSLEIVRQIARALDAAHAQGVVHRDVKPENILEESGQCFRLIDFGIAKGGTGQTVDTSPGMVMGSPGYLAPEVIRGEAVDARTDLYSLGVVLFELLAGRPPFVASSALHVMAAHVNDPVPSIRRFTPDCPASVEQLVSCCLTKQPADRVSSAAELVEQLSSCISRIEAASEPGGAERPGRTRSSSAIHARSAPRTARFTGKEVPARLDGASSARVRRKRRSRAWIAGALGVCGAVIVAAYAVRSPRKVEPAPVPSVAPSSAPAARAGLPEAECAQVAAHIAELYQRIGARTQSRIIAASNVAAASSDLLGNPQFGLKEDAVRVCAEDYHWLDDWLRSVEKRFSDGVAVKDRPLVLRAQARRYTIRAYMADMKGELKLSKLERVDPALDVLVKPCQDSSCYGLLAGYLNALVPAIEACAGSSELSSAVPGLMHDQMQIARTVYAYGWCEGLERQRDYRAQQSRKQLTQRASEGGQFGFLCSLAAKAWDRGADRQLVPQLTRSHLDAKQALDAQSWLTKPLAEEILREAFPKP